MLAVKNILKEDLIRKAYETKANSLELYQYLESLLNFEISVFDKCDESLLHGYENIHYDIASYNLYYNIVNLFGQLMHYFKIESASATIEETENEFKGLINRLYKEKVTGQITSFPVVGCEKNIEDKQVSVILYDAYHDPDDFCGSLLSSDFRNIKFHQDILKYFNFLFEEFFHIKESDYSLASYRHYDSTLGGLTNLYTLDKNHPFVKVKKVVERIH